MAAKLKFHATKFHFVGVGGIGMCGLAELLSNMGAVVTGSDVSQNAQTEYLKSVGVEVIVGHSKENIGDVDVVVYSSAIVMTNPEIVEALRRKIPVIRRAEALAEIMRLKRGVAIAGTHGKTTTTSLTACVLIAANMDPTAVVGGRLDLFKSTAKLGNGDWLVAEADESDGSFHRLSPEVVVITNIDTDHLDHYKSFETLKRAFFDFASIIPFYGVAIVCGDDPVIQEVFKSFSKRLITYGFGEHNDYRIQKVSAGRYSISHLGDLVGEFNNRLPGDHNALNATAAIIAGLQTGAGVEHGIQAIESFRGVDRRFQHKGFAKGVDFYDDYGHHPTEVKAVLKGFRDHFGARKIKVLFQPHRYSRTQICWNEFLTSFRDADEVYVAEIYKAGETPIEGITGRKLAEAIDHSHVQFIDLTQTQELEKFKSELLAHDVVVTLGAGDVYKVGEKMLESLARS
jgi:UDP-N-acetylmuramate--alanine ligase